MERPEEKALIEQDLAVIVKMKDEDQSNISNI